MGLKGKSVCSKASGINGLITGIDKDGLKITFTKFQDIVVPLNRIDDLLKMDEETKEALKAAVRKLGSASKKRSKTRTCIDDPLAEMIDDDES